MGFLKWCLGCIIATILFVVLVVAWLLWGLTSPLEAGEPCSCTETEQVFFFTTVAAEEAELMEDFWWKFNHCEAGTVYVDLIGTDSPEFSSYQPAADGNEQFYYEHRWVRFDQLETTLAHCRQPLS